MARRLRVHTRESARKPIRTNTSAEERNENAKRALSRWAGKCREEGPTLFRGLNGVWHLTPDKPLRKSTSSK